MSEWTLSDIPSQTGRLAVVTGATGGLGYETALALAAAGGEVILAGRNPAKGRDALKRILEATPGAKVRFEELDLASLASVAAFADRLISQGKPIDLLVNNAGVMALPEKGTTTDGFEMQLGTNYLGHYALTARLLPLLRRGKQPRVVQLSSTAHRMGAIRFDDLQSERSYSPWKAYSQSKLAMLMFALELQRRSDAGGWGLMSNGAHPGYARTDLIANGPGNMGILTKLNVLVQPLISQSAAGGALPTLLAATSPDAEGKGYYGPDGLFELKGAPTKAHIAKQARDEAAGARLWDVSEKLTGVKWSTDRAKAAS
jgi:NAD(P)-dependent dehydrogenase (short-subunit alcohol dehydrogenase family)